MSRVPTYSPSTGTLLRRAFWRVLHVFGCPLRKLVWHPVWDDVTVCPRCNKHEDYDPARKRT